MQGFIIFNKETEILKQHINIILFLITMTSYIDDLNLISSNSCWYMIVPSFMTLEQIVRVLWKETNCPSPNTQLYCRPKKPGTLVLNHDH